MFEAFFGGGDTGGGATAEAGKGEQEFSKRTPRTTPRLRERNRLCEGPSSPRGSAASNHGLEPLRQVWKDRGSQRPSSRERRCESRSCERSSSSGVKERDKQQPSSTSASSTDCGNSTGAPSAATPGGDILSSPGGCSEGKFPDAASSYAGSGSFRGGSRKTTSFGSPSRSGSRRGGRSVSAENQSLRLHLRVLEDTNLSLLRKVRERGIRFPEMGSIAGSCSSSCAVPPPNCSAGAPAAGSSPRGCVPPSSGASSESYYRPAVEDWWASLLREGSKEEATSTSRDRDDGVGGRGGEVSPPGRSLHDAAAAPLGSPGSPNTSLPADTKRPLILSARGSPRTALSEDTIRPPILSARVGGRCPQCFSPHGIGGKIVSRSAAPQLPVDEVSPPQLPVNEVPLPNVLLEAPETPRVLNELGIKGKSAKEYRSAALQLKASWLADQLAEKELGERFSDDLIDWVLKSESAGAIYQQWGTLPLAEKERGWKLILDDAQAEIQQEKEEEAQHQSRGRSAAADSLRPLGTFAGAQTPQGWLHVPQERAEVGDESRLPDEQLREVEKREEAQQQNASSASPRWRYPGVAERRLILRI